MAITRPQNQRRREIPISVKEWGGLQSDFPDKVIPLNAFSGFLNMMWDGRYKLRSRQGSKLYMDNDVVGSNKVLEAFEFKKSTDISGVEIFATSNGKLYRKEKGASASAVLIGSLTNIAPVRVQMAQLKDALYIADGLSAMKYDGETLTDIKDTFPTISPLTTGEIVSVTTSRNQIWWADSNDYIYASAYNAPDDLTTEALGAWKGQIQFGDGARITSLIPWGSTILINKEDSERSFYLMYWLKGLNTTSSPYRIDPLFGDAHTPVGFIGKSGVQIQGDVVGLTLDGFVSVSAINTFQEAKPGVISSPIGDVVDRINFYAPNEINAVYDNVLNYYLCAVPLDGANYATHIIVYDVQNDRWTLWNNWDVRCWFKSGSNTLFGTNDGKLVQIRQGENDLGGGFKKEIVTGASDSDAPDIDKVFKAVELDMEHAGEYDIDYYFAVDGVEIENPIKLKVLATGSHWDVFVWDEDKWDGEGTSIRNILIQARGKTLTHRFVNTNADEPLIIESMTTRILVKDAGQPKT